MYAHNFEEFLRESQRILYNHQESCKIFQNPKECCKIALLLFNFFFQFSLGRGVEIRVIKYTDEKRNGVYLHKITVAFRIRARYDKR